MFDDKYFGDMHLRQLLMQQQDDGGGCLYNSNLNNGNLCFIFSGYSFLYTLEIDEQSRKKVRKINVPLPSTMCAVIGSCNGLVCLAKRNHFGTYYPAYICNPITKERIDLPFFITNKKEKDVRRVLSGFGYVLSTNEYKVVRIVYYYGNEDLSGHVQVYTLGDGSGWRDKEETHYQLSNEARNNVLANGDLHWLDSQGNIVAFSLAKEEFQLLSPPPCLPASTESQIFKLCVLGGCLCVFHQQRGYVSNATLWMLKKKTSGDCGGKEQEDYDSLSWNKEFTLPFESLSWSKTFTLPFAITKSGEILISLFEIGKSIICYDTNTSTTKERWEVDQILFRFEAAPHMHSFVSLKECIRKKTDRDLNYSRIKIES